MEKHTLWRRERDDRPECPAHHTFLGLAIPHDFANPAHQRKSPPRHPPRKGGHTAGRFQLDDYGHDDGESGWRLGSLLTTEMTSDAFVCCPLRW